MNPFEMVIGIVLIVSIAGVLRAKYGYSQDKHGNWKRDSSDQVLQAENTALREELRGVKDRLQVLERLATDDESGARRLDREIEQLRDKNSLQSGRLTEER